jgi:hypothetical protein
MASTSTTVKQREEQRRREKLSDIRQQVKEGSLVIRQMTPEERAANPPSARQRKRPR